MTPLDLLVMILFGVFFATMGVCCLLILERSVGRWGFVSRLAAVGLYVEGLVTVMLSIGTMAGICPAPLQG